MDRDAFAAELARAEAAADAHAAELRQHAGVVLVGAGAERRRGQLTGRAAIVVSVREKLSRRALRAAGIEPLPESIEGVPVDVVVYAKPVESPELRRAFQRALAAKDAASAFWLAQPNVTGIGVGYKERSGQSTGEVAVQVFVERKLALSELADLGLSQVPEELRGVVTDVVELPPLREMVPPSGSRADRRDPLVGGLSVGHASTPFSYGTLGAIAFDAANNAVALSNEHVLDGDIGETVHQPSPVGLDDSFKVELQLNVCNPLDFLRVDTPDTTGGTILAGAAAAVAIAAALSDEIDPTREGQAATAPPAGAVTWEEAVSVAIDYPMLPLPGRAFECDVDWQYERRTTTGTLRHSDRVHRVNRHVLAFHRLFTDRSRYQAGTPVRLIGVVVPPGDYEVSCADYHCVALLRPVGRDQSVPIVLRPWAEASFRQQVGTHLSRAVATELNAPSGEQLIEVLLPLGLTEEDAERLRAAGDRVCLYYGEYPSERAAIGPWRHWLHVQTQNTVPPGTDPLEAATIIGGLAVSDHYAPTVDVACGPLVFQDDGSFDIEPLTI